MSSATRIAHITAREVLDSRGRPTVEADVHLRGGVIGRASVPSGASTGRHEAVELRDGDPARHRGKGVRKAVHHVEAELLPAVKGLDAADQQGLDRRLIEQDGTPNKGRLGANAILAVSLAGCRAGAHALGRPLYAHIHELYAAHDPAPPPIKVPLPMVNIISGGAHAGGQLDLQDFLAMPVGAQSYTQAMEWVAEVYAQVADLLAAAGKPPRLVADEGGWGPELERNEQAVELLVEAFGQSGLQAGRDIGIALDVAATQFVRDDGYRLDSEARTLRAPELADLLGGWLDRYPILSIEDPFAEDDWEPWANFTRRYGRQVQIVGDDLFTTHPERVQRGIDTGCANAVLVKVNQIGSLSEALAVIAQARRAGFGTVVSARSGETEDAFLADLAAGSGAGQIKIGSITRSERLAKYNRLFQIEGELAHGCEPGAVFAGAGPVLRRRV